MNIFPRFLILGLAVLTASCGSQLLAAKEDQRSRANLKKQLTAKIERLQKSKKPSISKGRLTEGTLAHPAELAAPEGVGYYLSHPIRRTNFGHDRLVFGLMALGVHLRGQLGDHPDHRLRIHDLSSKAGGKQKRHINHQMGLDVDLVFYATDLEGNVTRSIMTSYGADGKSTDGDYLFDLARNWEVVAGIVENEYFGEVRSILISNDLKRKLLTYANKLAITLASENSAERAALDVIIKKAEALMRQPESSPHDNHFHLSLSNIDRP